MHETELFALERIQFESTTAAAQAYGPPSAPVDDSHARHSRRMEGDVRRWARECECVKGKEHVTRRCYIKRVIGLQKRVLRHYSETHHHHRTDIKFIQYTR